MFVDETPRSEEFSDLSGPFSDGTPTHRDETEGRASTSAWTPPVHRTWIPPEEPQGRESLPSWDAPPNARVTPQVGSLADSSPYSVVVYVSPSLKLGWGWQGVIVLAGFVLGFFLAEALIRLWTVFWWTEF